ncbi:hypothetical protein pb186bvf_010277 [Paramecium bursaria]
MQTGKETVQTICTILQAFGLKNIDPNHFRQAKHDQQDAIKPMSIILYNILILELYDFEFKLQDIQVQHETPDCLEIILLAIRKSPFIAYKNGKPGMNYSSSRDILLNIGQILAENDIFEKYKNLIVKKVSQVKVKVQQNLKPIEVEINNIKFNSEGNQNQDLEHLTRIIRHQLKQLNLLIKRKEHSQSQIEKIIQQMNLKDMTVETLLSLTNHEELEIVLNDLKDIIVFLEQETSLHRHQDVFWAWMESIVDEDKRDIKDHVDYGFPDEKIQFQVGQQICNISQIFQQKLQKLQQVFEEFDSTSQQFEDEWERVSQLLQQDQQSQQKLQQLQLHVHKIMAKNNIDFLNIKTFKEQKFQEKDILYCHSNDFIKQELRKQFFVNKNKNISEETFNLDLRQEEISNRMHQLKNNVEYEVKKMKQVMKELTFFPK